jgi:hypothetical protein
VVTRAHDPSCVLGGMSSEQKKWVPLTSLEKKPEQGCCGVTRPVGASYHTCPGFEAKGGPPIQGLIPNAQDRYCFSNFRRGVCGAGLQCNQEAMVALGDGTDGVFCSLECAVAHRFPPNKEVGKKRESSLLW